MADVVVRIGRQDIHVVAREGGATVASARAAFSRGPMPCTAVAFTMPDDTAVVAVAHKGIARLSRATERLSAGGAASTPHRLKLAIRPRWFDANAL